MLYHARGAIPPRHLDLIYQGMPIYKISRRENAEKRARAKFARIRLTALLLSAVFGLGTILMLLHGVGK